MFIIKRYLLFTTLLLAAGMVKASEPPDSGNITIHIAATASVILDAHYWWDIYRTKNNLKIVYSREHAFRREGIRIFKDSVSVFTKDFSTYDTLLREINKASAKDLENAEANKNRIVFDGTSFRFTIISTSEKKEVYSHSPSEASNPLLHQLLNQTSNIYRNNHISQPIDFNNAAIYVSVSQNNLYPGQHLMLNIYKTNNNVKAVYTWRGKVTDNATYDSVTADSILFDRKTRLLYDSLLNKFISTDLKNNPSTKNIWGGVIVQIDIAFKSDYRVFFLNAPDSKSNPLVYEFLTQMLGLYHGSQKNIFSDKQKTFGY